MQIRVLAFAATALIPFSATPAQDSATVPAPRIVAPRNVISVQPINAVLTAYSAEYERQAASAVTIGVGGTYFKNGDDVDELIYKSGDLKLRYYPQGTALMGFSFGGTVGFSSITGTDAFDGTKVTDSGASFGVLLEYQWLMGSARNFAVALGVGAKAVMVKEGEFTSTDFTARYPTARISVGLAF